MVNYNGQTFRNQESLDKYKTKLEEDKIKGHPPRMNR
jgi:hypothetical protein